MQRFGRNDVVASTVALLLLSLGAAAQEERDKEREKKPQPAPKARPAPAATRPEANRPANTPAHRPGETTPNRQNNPGATMDRGRGPAPANAGRPPAAQGNLNRGGANFNRGSQGRPVPPSSRVVETRAGGSVTMRANGRPAVVHAANGVEVQHNLTGRTVVVRETTDRTRIVVEHDGHGYVQHPYQYGGHPYFARTYYAGGRPYERFYRGYPYHGVYLEVYAPARYYPLGFYGWAVNPWAAPVTFSWGWGARPWYGYYGWYFNPYPVYSSPALWLTDYMISESLAAAYQSQVNNQIAMNQPPPQQPVALTPEVKDAIADEVRRQIALENSEAQANARGGDPNAPMGIAQELADNNPHVFVVGAPLDLVSAAGQECAVTEGDVLQLAGPPAPDSPTATLIVMAGKGGAIECRRGSSVAVALTDLQDMQNHMRETLDAGMADLQAHQNGLPMPPQTALAMPMPAAYSSAAPPPDPTVASQLNQQLQQGTQAEQQTLADAGSGVTAAIPPAAGAAPPPTVTLGQSPDQVAAILGQPTQVVDLGPKKIYVYPSLKVTFNDGKVTDVE